MTWFMSAMTIWNGPSQWNDLESIQQTILNTGSSTSDLNILKPILAYEYLNTFIWTLFINQGECRGSEPDQILSWLRSLTLSIRWVSSKNPIFYKISALSRLLSKESLPRDISSCYRPKTETVGFLNLCRQGSSLTHASSLDGLSAEYHVEKLSGVEN